MNKEFTFLNNTKITFASSSESQKLLGTSDGFTQILSGVDVAARLENVATNTEKDYLDFAANQASEWTTAEKEATQKMLRSVEQKMVNLGLNLNLPTEIVLVKSSMKEEGSAGGYTRGNYIVLGKTPSEGLFVHELFHVYSRHNPTKRDELYQTLHFQKCNKIEFLGKLKDLKITNPDAPIIEHFLPIEIGGQKKNVTFVTHASRPYDGGNFFTYLNKKIMILEEVNGRKQPKLKEGEAILLDYKAVPNLEKWIGNNTGYNIHPEEILADHFKLLVNGDEVPMPTLLEAMKTILQ